MSVLTIVKPEIGKPDLTQDPKIVNALTAIENWANGNISSENLLEAAEILGTQIKNGTITEAQLGEALKTTLAERAGLLSQKSIIATEQAREKNTFGTLATPDEVTVTLPENGLIAIVFQAKWKTTGNPSNAAIFLDSNQLKTAAFEKANPVVQTTAIKLINKWSPLATYGGGLISESVTTEYLGDVTTGQVAGYNPQNATEWGYGGPCYVFAAAGTHKVSVQFAASSGKVTVSNRKLWVWVVA